MTRPDHQPPAADPIADLCAELRATHCSNENLHDNAAYELERLARTERLLQAGVRHETARAERDTLRECVKAADGQLSRILHELAGSASRCWEPTPTGVFHSTQACEFVAAAIDELRAILRGDAAERAEAIASELREIGEALQDPRENLTHTTAQCVALLRAERDALRECVRAADGLRAECDQVPPMVQQRNVLHAYDAARAKVKL